MRIKTWILRGHEHPTNASGTQKKIYRNLFSFPTPRPRTNMEPPWLLSAFHLGTLPSRQGNVIGVEERICFWNSSRKSRIISLLLRSFEFIHFNGWFWIPRNVIFFNQPPPPFTLRGLPAGTKELLIHLLICAYLLPVIDWTAIFLEAGKRSEGRIDEEGWSERDLPKKHQELVK